MGRRRRSVAGARDGGFCVIDVSITLAVTSASTNAPTILIAEEGAVMLKAAVRERLTA
jgi:hypothetical protein